jgi:hypothetical protein
MLSIVQDIDENEKELLCGEVVAASEQLKEEDDEYRVTNGRT